MKKILLVAMLSLSMTAIAQGDRDSNDGVKIVKGEKDLDVSTHIAVGVNVPTGAPDGYKFAPFRSWNIDFTLAQFDYQPKRGKQTYSIGVGLGWHNYSLKKNDTYFVKDEHNVVGLATAPANMKKDYSRLHEMAIIVPVLFNQSFSDKFSLSLGAQVNFNVKGRLNWGYTSGDDSYDITTKGIEYKVVTLDLMAIFHVNDGGFYVKYNPISPFKKDKGPDFKYLALGIYF